ncbi:condensation domain-containing protein [Streptomyces canus]|uniref:condensation domain-containing protein n=1 Tax=Streptomyces canus TaxID=58343 RepID=UPI0033BE74A5
MHQSPPKESSQTKQPARSELPPSSAEGEVPFPLTVGQIRRWKETRRATVHQLSPAYLLQGPLDFTTFTAALTEVVAHHENLRIRITERDGEPEATLLPPQTTPSTALVDLAGLDESTQLRLVSHYSTEEAAQPLDLSVGPLRCTVLRLDAERHVLLTTLSHVVADGWSVGVLFRDLQSACTALALGASFWKPAEERAPFREFVEAQQSQAHSKAVTEGLAWWVRQLDGADWDVGIDDYRSDDHNGMAASHPFVLPEETGRALRALARSERTSVFAASVTALAVVLCRRAGRNDIVVTVPYFGRDTPGHEYTVGLYVNRLALRLPMDEDASFAWHLRQTREVLLDALDHRDVPYELISDALSTPEKPAIARIVMQTVPQSMFEESEDTSCIRFTLLNFRDLHMQRELGLSLPEPEEGGATFGGLRHRLSFVPASVGAELVCEYLRMLSSAASTPHTPVRNLGHPPARGTLDAELEQFFALSPLHEAIVPAIRLPGGSTKGRNTAEPW